jgi:hypothetical protein
MPTIFVEPKNERVFHYTITTITRNCARGVEKKPGEGDTENVLVLKARRNFCVMMRMYLWVSAGNFCKQEKRIGWVGVSDVGLSRFLIFPQKNAAYLICYAVLQGDN